MSEVLRLHGWSASSPAMTYQTTSAHNGVLALVQISVARCLCHADDIRMVDIIFLEIRFSFDVSYFIGVTFTEHAISHLQVCNSETLVHSATWIVPLLPLSSSRIFLSFPHRQNKSLPFSSWPPPAPGNYESTFCLCICLFCACHVNGIMHYVTFVTSFCS